MIQYMKYTYVMRSWLIKVRGYMFNLNIYSNKIVLYCNIQLLYNTLRYGYIINPLII